MPKHFRVFLLLAVLSSCNLVGGTSNSPDRLKGDDDVGADLKDVRTDFRDVGIDVEKVSINNDTSIDLGPCTDGVGCESGVCEAGVSAWTPSVLTALKTVRKQILIVVVHLVRQEWLVRKTLIAMEERVRTKYVNQFLALTNYRTEMKAI